MTKTVSAHSKQTDGGTHYSYYDAEHRLIEVRSHRKQNHSVRYG
ncbi:hypothetical protein ABVF47_007535 [Snodgrassella alvi]|nr:hypothetical protein [Snodgrassella sp. B3800]